MQRLVFTLQDLHFEIIFQFVLYWLASTLF